MLTASSSPTPRLMARSMTSRDMLAVRALSTTRRRRGLSSITPPPVRAATVISRMNLVKILLRLASWAALRWRVLAHLEWPAIGLLLGFVFFPQADADFAQLLGIHRRRCLGHHTGSGLGFGECNHVTDGRCTGHQHDQTIQTEGQTTMRRTAEFQRIQQEAEFLVGLVVGNFQGAEHRLLHFRTVDTDG